MYASRSAGCRSSSGTAVAPVYHTASRAGTVSFERPKAIPTWTPRPAPSARNAAASARVVSLSSVNVSSPSGAVTAVAVGSSAAHRSTASRTSPAPVRGATTGLAVMVICSPSGMDPAEF
jgi:hypothetical protein